MKSRKFALISPLVIMPVAVSAVSCIKTSNLSISSNLLLHIPKEYDIIPQVLSNKEVVTENIIKSLLSLTFEDDIVKKNEYVKSQEDEKKLFSEIKKLSKKVPYFVRKGKNQKPGHDHLKMVKKHKEELNNFYSKNWLFMLKNIDKFAVRPFEVWTLEKTGNAEHSSEFLNKSKDQNPGIDSFSFASKNIDSLIQGGESAHTPGKKVMYIKKDKLIIRVVISKDAQYPFKIDKFIHFSLYSRDNKISMKFISDIIHSAIYHKDPKGYQSFEEDLVKKNYNYPFLSTLTLKEGGNDEK
ncbi:hypothetical protein NQV05_02535 [Mycoplasmopsis agalactiae]|uniref:aromatic motif membrane protein n=1 Tax=Mycoplasmopsis agalactiae TaxID=2110 RepID=UPI00211C48E1|nr:aromatic motif membrane protein [Mycoplasmopsis agalactiae]UUM25255.1 hypothetical protein NQV05_02535 [Mycoplasmopsis agalactiae]